MINGIFRRLFLTNIIIVMMVLVIVAAASTMFTNWYYQQQEQHELEAQGNVITNHVKAYLNGTTDVIQLQKVVDALANTTTTRIVVLQARPNTADTLKTKLSQVKSEKDIVRIYTKVLQGKKVVEHRSLFYPFQTSALVVAMPVVNQGSVQAVVFLYTPLKESVETLKGFYQIIWGTALGALLVAAGFIFAISRRIVSPISQMAAGARAISRGETVNDFAVRGRDEIADLAAAFNQMKNEIAHTEQIRRDLITDVSHELRTPLTSVRGFIQAIIDGVVAPGQEPKYLRLAYDELQRVTALVHDLLDLSRLQAGTATIHKEQVNLNQVVSRAVTMLEYQAIHNEITIIVDSAQTLYVWGDSDRLCQIALNLIQNAISYSPRGSDVLVKLTAANKMATLSVKDQGIGIKEEDLPYIFDRFKRGTNNTLSGGTGVGLAIVKALVEAHDGYLTTYSLPGAGTDILVHLPLFTDN